MEPHFDDDRAWTEQPSEDRVANMAQGAQLTAAHCRQWIHRIGEPAALCRFGRVVSVNRLLLAVLGLSDDARFVGEPPEVLIDFAVVRHPGVHSSITRVSLYEEAGDLLVLTAPTFACAETSAETGADAATVAPPEEPKQHPVDPAAIEPTEEVPSTVPSAVLQNLEALAASLWELPAEAMVPAREIFEQLRRALEAADPDETDPLDLSEMVGRALQQLDASRFRLAGDEEPLLTANGERAGALVLAMLRSSIAQPGAIARLHTSSDATGAPVLEISRADQPAPLFESEVRRQLRTEAQQLGGSLVELESGRVVRLRLRPAKP